jgi:hypothetical protein
LTHEDLEEWLATYPWLLILDGLDEVPATSNRHALVDAVTGFLADARQAGADLFVVATSRQQGYAGEFSDGIVAIRHILPLSTIRALRYVERYATARFGVTDSVRATDIVNKLRESASRQLTAQLMTSPLQVTFMATVVAARGDPGEDRWQLFDSYYRTIYDRERQKAVPPYDMVLSKQQPTIDRLHHDIGFWLQFRGETAGGTAVSLPIAQFERLVDSYLYEIGREGAEKDEMVKLITDAARHRLVFLTSRVSGELSFDVRSLQEYMAAECLMTGAPDLVTARLKAIASVAYWRNVFLFAASKCFVDARSRHLQSTIRILCEDLNAPGDALLDATKAGSELAIDVLQSGAVAENPNNARHLARIGLGLLSQPYMIVESEEGASVDQRLARVYSEPLKQTYLEELQLRVGQADVNRTLGAWPLLTRLIDLKLNWAVDVGNINWPSDHSEQRSLLCHMPSDLIGTPWLWKMMEDAIWSQPPSKAWRLLARMREARMRLEPPNVPLGALYRLLILHQAHTRIRVKTERENCDGMVLRIGSVVSRDSEYTSLLETLALLSFNDPGWTPFVLADLFLKAPDAHTLAGVLDRCADAGWDTTEKAQLHFLPWPMATCLGAARTVEDLRRIAQELRKGKLGDSTSWTASEQRWMGEGIYIDALRRRSPEGVLLDHGDTLGPPAATGLSIETKSYPDSVIQSLFGTAQQTHGHEEMHMIMWFMCMASSHTGGIARCIEASAFEKLWTEYAEGGGTWFRNFVGYPSQPELVSSWMEFFDWLGCSTSLSPYYDPYSAPNYGLKESAREWDAGWSRIFQDAFISSGAQHGLSRFFGRDSNRSRLGLLRMLGRLASVGHSMEAIPAELLNPDSFSDGRFRLAALIVRLAQETLTRSTATHLADEAIKLLDPLAEMGADNLLLMTAEKHLRRIPAIEYFLLRLRERMPAKVELGVARCERLLRLVVRERASGLQHHGQIASLELPMLY